MTSSGDDWTDSNLRWQDRARRDLLPATGANLHRQHRRRRTGSQADERWRRTAEQQQQQQQDEDELVWM